MKYLIIIVTFSVFSQTRIEVFRKSDNRLVAADEGNIVSKALIKKKMKDKGHSTDESLYNIVVTDVSAEKQAERDAFELRKTEIKQIKQTVDQIEQSSKPAWEKRLLKRLALELREWPWDS